MCGRSTVTEELRESALRVLSAALSARNHKRAVEILWELHRDEVLRYCRRRLASEAEAADVTQKVFVNAIRDLDRLRSVDSSSRWLMGIARHRCLDHARSTRRDPQLVDADMLCQIAGDAFTAEPDARDASVVNRLGQCLNRLDALDRELIELRFYEGLPFKEIAKQLGRTPASLRVRLTRACGFLRKQLTSGRSVAMRRLRA
jgi:RNA polymerase sigma-70 factor (ECF subfamily)